MTREPESQIHPTNERRRDGERLFVEDEPPPFGGSWRRLYTFVLVNLLVLTVLYYIFTKAFE